MKVPKLQLKAFESILPNLVSQYDKFSIFDILLYPSNFPLQTGKASFQILSSANNAFNLTYPISFDILISDDLVRRVQATLLISGSLKLHASHSLSLSYSIDLESLKTFASDSSPLTHEWHEAPQPLIPYTTSPHYQLPISLECFGLSDS
jgi:hypothetical protein